MNQSFIEVGDMSRGGSAMAESARPSGQLVRAFENALDFQAALQRAEGIAAAISAVRSYYFSGEVGEIFGFHENNAVAFSKAGRLPPFTVINGCTAFEIDAILTYLRQPSLRAASMPGGSCKPTRVRNLLRNWAADTPAKQGTRTGLVLQMLQERPRTTIELMQVVGRSAPAIIYRLRRRGCAITTHRVLLIDDDGVPHPGAALYELLKPNTEHAEVTAAPANRQPATKEGL